MLLKPPKGAKSNRAWIGREFTTARQLSNGYQVVPAGTRVRCTDTMTGRGLEIRTDPCPHCGVSVKLRGVHPDDDLLPWPTQEPGARPC